MVESSETRGPSGWRPSWQERQAEIDRETPGYWFRVALVSPFILLGLACELAQWVRSLRMRVR